MELETTLNWQQSLALGYKDESPNCNLYVNFMWVRENVWVRRESKKKKKKLNTAILRIFSVQIWTSEN